MPSRNILARVRRAGVVEDPIGFLMRTGLLYHINKTVFHPLGLGLVGMPGRGGRMTAILIDRRDEPFLHLTEREYLDGESKLVDYMAVDGRPTMARRKARLGFVEQPGPIEVEAECEVLDIQRGA